MEYNIGDVLFSKFQTYVNLKDVNRLELAEKGDFFLIINKYALEVTGRYNLRYNLLSQRTCSVSSWHKQEIDASFIKL